MEKSSITIIVAIIGFIGVTLAALIMTGVIFPRRNIRFKIVDSNTKQPIEFAKIEIGENTKQTKSDGTALFTKQRKGYKDFVIVKEKYNDYTGTAQIIGRDNIQEVFLVIADSIPIPEPYVEIETPQDESNQNSPVIVAGVCDNLPTNKHYWIVVNPHDSNGFWPQTSEMIIKKDKTWKSKARFDGNVGQRFDLHFIMADDIAHQSFNSYLSNGLKTKDFPERPLPSGAKSLGFVTIIKN